MVERGHDLYDNEDFTVIFRLRLLRRYHLHIMMHVFPLQLTYLKAFGQEWITGALVFIIYHYCIYWYTKSTDQHTMTIS